MSLVDEVGSLVREVGKTELLARFRALRDEDVSDKGDGELVTVADRAAEKRLTEELGRILPGSSVVGEEACAANPALLDSASSGRVWIVDPLDGTGNYAAGEGPFGIIVALLDDGAPQAGWIYLPLDDTLAAGSRESGVRLGGDLVALGHGSTTNTPSGAILNRFFPPPLRERVESGTDGLQLVPGQRCAAQRYVELLRGAEQFALYYRTLPWDHAAGALLTTLAGGVAERFDGDRFDPLDERTGLLVAANHSLARALRTRLLV